MNEPLQKEPTNLQALDHVQNFLHARLRHVRLLHLTQLGLLHEQPLLKPGLLSAQQLKCAQQSLELGTIVFYPKAHLGPALPQGSQLVFQGRESW